MRRDRDEHYEIKVDIRISCRDCLRRVAGVAAAAAAGAAKHEKSEGQRAETQQKLEAAQKRLDAAAREVAELSMSLSDDAMSHAMRIIDGMRAPCRCWA